MSPHPQTSVSPCGKAFMIQLTPTSVRRSKPFEECHVSHPTFHDSLLIYSTWLSGSLCALTSWLFLKSFFFLTLDLTLRKNCKVGTKYSCVVFTQLSWTLTSYITTAHVSKSGNGHWEDTVTYVQTLSGWHQLFHLKSCSVPGSSPEKHITLSHQDSLVFSDL